MNEASGRGAASGVTRGRSEAHELWVSDELPDAVRKVKITLKNLGELTEVVPGEAAVGVAKFGIYRTTLRIRWRSENVSLSGGKMPDETGAVSQTAAGASTFLGTVLLVTAECPAAPDAATRSTAEKSAIERFEEAYQHFDTPGYQPDRLGLLPMTVIGVIVFLVLVGYVVLRTPFMQRLLPNRPLTIQAAPSGDDSPQPDVPAAP
ncbi:MAG: hypothetical protein H7Z41_12955 [Cytophagales bacterium]|nr:hypothetical protein [Armatimonadota bacterium]